jgi:hypothetical protein
VPTPRHRPVEESANPDPNVLTKLSSNLSVASSNTDPTLVDGKDSVVSDTDAASSKSKRSWFKKKMRSKSTDASVSVSDRTDVSRRSEEDDVHSPLERTVKEEEWRLGDDMRQYLDM